jgi:diketogulonate reductase-like aldo/keto reductase
MEWGVKGLFAPAPCENVSMRTVKLPSGVPAPALGQGTWGMGESSAMRSREAAVLQLGLDLGMTLIDTAEMYGEGGAEEVVGAAIAGRREGVFLVSKFYPHHATRRLVAEACERSLRRLRTARIDLYLLHWRGSTPLAETLEGLRTLKRAGKIAEYGVSNFDTGDMEEALPPSGQDADSTGIAANQVLYNLSRRGIEWDLLPWLRERGIPLMAYSPVEQGRILNNPALASVAARHQATPAQVALAWLLRNPDIMVIPKASSPAHVRENRAAADLVLGGDDVAELERRFPAPTRKRPLEML